MVNNLPWPSMYLEQMIRWHSGLISKEGCLHLPLGHILTSLGRKAPEPMRSANSSTDLVYRLFFRIIMGTCTVEETRFGRWFHMIPMDVLLGSNMPAQ